MVAPSPDPDIPVPALAAEPDEALLRLVVADAAAGWAAARRARVDAFVDANFRLGPALRLHRRALGADLLRAPANLALALPHLAVQGAAIAARRAGRQPLADRLARQRLFFTSDVAREVEWRLHTDLLELPCDQGDRRYRRDSLAEAIFADPRLAGPLAERLAPLGRRAEDPAFRAWLTDAMGAYASTRVAAADLANAVVAAGVGALTFKQLTPGMATLGPALATAAAQQAAIAGFPLGAGLGGLWYSVAPASASAGAMVAATGGLMAGAAVLAAVSGAVTDPVQRRLGLHRRRLVRLIDAIEGRAAGRDARYGVSDPYVARILDLLDILRAAHGAVR